MRVLHALDVYLPISQNWIYPQITGVKDIQPGILCTQLTNSDVFPSDSTPFFQDPPPDMSRINLRRLSNSLLFRSGRPPFMLPTNLKKWEPQLIHAHFGTKGWSVLSFRKQLRIPLVTSFYGTDAWQFPETKPIWRERYKRLFEEGRYFAVEGPAMLERLVYLGCAREKIRVVRLGINPSHVPFRQRSFTEPLRILMMARFTEKKGFIDGLQACAQAVRSGVDLQVRVVGDAAGGDRDGQDIKRRLVEIATGPDLAGAVSFEGFVPPARAANIMYQCDVFLCPSKHSKNGDAEGGSPVALTEAMAAGLLCVGTRHCDIPELIHHGETGYLCDSGDVVGLACALSMVARHPSEAQGLTTRGRQHVETIFSVQTELRELGTIYSRMMNGAS